MRLDGHLFGAAIFIPQPHSPTPFGWGFIIPTREYGGGAEETGAATREGAGVGECMSVVATRESRGVCVVATRDTRGVATREGVGVCMSVVGTREGGVKKRGGAPNGTPRATLINKS